MARQGNPDADAILDQEFPVLNMGSVSLVDYMGSDSRIVEAARVSVGRKKSLRKDRDLIDYLVRNQHLTPMEFVSLTFRIRLPIFVARQLARYRHSSVVEVSGRYTELPPDFYVPEWDRILGQDTKNRQGSEGELPDDTRAKFLGAVRSDQSIVYRNYERARKQGISRELSRINLPVSIYTELVWKTDLRSLFNFLKQRLHPHAQKEMQEYASAMAVCTQRVAPMAYAAFEEHILEAVTFPASSARWLREHLRGVDGIPEGVLTALAEGR